LITGAGSGIGREVVYNLAKNHRKTILVLWDINESANQQLVDSVKLLGVEAFAYTVDVTDREQVANCARRVFEEVGYVTILFNNAGVLAMGDLLSQSPEAIELTMNVNVMSHFWILKAFLPVMIEQNYGHVVTTCSLAGQAAIPFDAPYCASKFAVRGYLDSLKLEMRLHPNKPRIRFTTVYPSFVNTPLIERVACTFNVPYLFDPVEPRYVAEQIVEGIRRNEGNVIVPKIFELAIILQTLMPRKLWERLSEASLISVSVAEQKPKKRK